MGLSEFNITFLVINLFAVIGCNTNKQVKGVTIDQTNDLSSVSCSLKVVDNQTFYPHHLSFEISSIKGCNICVRGMLNNLEMTVLATDQRKVLETTQGECMKHASYLEPGLKYSFLVLPQEYMRNKSLMSGYYYLFGAYTDVEGNRMLSDTLKFYYDATIDYKFRYRRDWSSEVFLSSHVTDDNKVVFEVYNTSNDTLDLSEVLLLEASPKRGEREIEDVPSFNISHLYSGQLLYPNQKNSIFLDCTHLDIFEKSEFHIIRLSFRPDVLVTMAGNIIHCK